MIRLNLAVLFLLCTAHLAAESNGDPVPFILTNQTGQAQPGFSQEILEDREQKLTIEDVISHSGFAKTTRFIPNAGITTSAYWVRFNVINQSDRTDWILQEAFPLIEDLQVFLISSNGTIIKKQAGISLPFRSREIFHRTFLFKTQLVQNERYAIYARFVTRPAMNMPLSFWTPEALSEADSQESIFMGMYYGIIIVMALYNLFLFFSVRDTSYLYYALFSLSGGAFMASQLGHAYQFFWPNSPWFVLKGNVLLNALFSLFAVVFVRNFLRLKEKAPLLNIIALGLLWTGVILALASMFAPYQLVIRILLLVTLFSSAFFLSGGILLSIRGDRHAILFTVAYAVFMVGATLYALRNLGVLPFVPITSYALQIGSAIELIIMSLALADRINSLRMERERAAYSDRMKSEFLALMSHEIRTPMSAVIGMSRILGETELKAEQKEMLTVIQKSGNALLTIMNDILDFSRLEAGKMDLEKSEFELRSVFIEVLDLLKPAAQEKDLGLFLEMQRELPLKVIGDAPRLRQVIMNLASNAIKFTEKGHVLVQISTVPNREDRVFVCVADTGIGIASENYDTLFKPFTQIGSFISRKVGGTGLGLVISQQLVSMMGGKIEFESRRGLGTRFFFEMDLTFVPGTAVESVEGEMSTTELATAAKQNTQRETHSIADQYPHTILVAEDDDVNRKIICKFLQRLGYEADEAANGLQVLDKVNKLKYSVLFMDIQMPQLDGLETARRIVKTLGKKRPRMVATTANTRKEDRQKCEEAGMDDFLTKPFTVESLKEILIRYKTTE